MEHAQVVTYPREIPEDAHWWFATRTWAIEQFLAPAFGSKRSFGETTPVSGKPPLGEILDIGCGAGNMIHHLSHYGRVRGIEVDPRPVKIAQARGYDVRQGDATRTISFPDACFDLVTALDVIEHVDADDAILREAYRVLRPGGRVLITTPAFQWLWSFNDKLNAHKRRYTAGELRSKLEHAGFKVERISYNFFLVFPMAAALIALKNLTGKRANLKSHHYDDQAYQVDMEPVSPALNTLLRSVGSLEAQLISAVNLPFGTSLIAMARKKG